MRWGGVAEGGIGPRGETIVFDGTAGELTGTSGNDLVIAGLADSVSAGDGDDIVMVDGRSNGTVDAGGGKDVFVHISAVERSSSAPQGVNYVFESVPVGGYGKGAEGDRIWFPDFPVGTVAEDLGGGLVEFSVEQGTADGTPGRMLVLDVVGFQAPDGSPLSLGDVADAVFLGPEAIPLDPDSYLGPLDIIVANAGITRDETLVGTALGDFIAVSADDGVERVLTGPGDDAVYAKRAGAAQDLAIELGPGVGKTVILEYTGPSDADVEECLIFDISGGGLSARQGSVGQANDSATNDFNLVFITDYADPQFEVDATGAIRIFDGADPAREEFIRAADAAGGSAIDLGSFIPSIEMLPPASSPPPPPPEGDASGASVEIAPYSPDDLGW